MSRGESEFACGFCGKVFASLHGKLRHLKSCKEVLSEDRRHPRLPADRTGAREHHRHP